jgi:dihydrofolate synthase/folylpolyglutamate synthase
VAAIRGRIDHWLPVTLPGARAATAAELTASLAAVGISSPLPICADAAAAYAYARKYAGEDDRIIAFGSFLTVAGVLHAMGRTVA